MTERLATPDLASTAAVLADPSRVAMALVMMDGRAWTMTELAAAAGISRSTATEHGHRLVQSGFCDEVRQGRHRYLRLRGPEVAALLELLGALSSPPLGPRSELRAVTRDAALRLGRTCYGHLAGRLGVSLCEELRRMDVITPDWQPGPEAEGWFAQLGIDLHAPSRRLAARPCLDWTERREHLAGRLADQLCGTLIERGWIRRRPETRAVSPHNGGNCGPLPPRPRVVAGPSRCRLVE